MRSRPSFHDALLVAWIVLIAADRIDLAGGAGPFILTPFLALTPFVLLSEAYRVLVRGRRVHWTRWGTAYAVACLALLAIVFLSVLLALDPESSVMRASHLLVLVVSTLAVAAVLVRRPRAEWILVSGAKIGLAVALVFSVWQIGYFLGGGSEPLPVGMASINLSIPAYAGIVPRLSGQVSDMNRAGFLYVFYLYVLARWAAPGMRRRVWVGLGLVLLLATLSRSALLALGVASLVTWLERPGVAPSRPGVVAAATALAVPCVWILLDPFGVEAVGRALEPLQSRFSLAEGSAQSHFELLGRGVAEAGESVKRALIGVGYGNAWVVLQDVFPGSRYGNFHSLYVTFLAESGAFAFVTVLVLIGWPILRGGPVRPLVAGIAAYNVFYQVSAEPLLWFVLAWAWLTLPVPAGVPPREAESDAGAAAGAGPHAMPSTGSLAK